MRSPLTARRLESAAPLMLLAWVLLNYGWTLGFGFMNDDYIWIDGARWPADGAWLRTAFVPPAWSGSFLRPLVQLSFFVNYLASGISPVGYRACNVLLQVANTYLVWRLAHALAIDSVPALWAALLFAVHPSHAEVVTWISGRTELIATACYLTALLQHRARRTGWAAVWFALALLAKESAASLVFIVVAIDLLAPRGARWRPGPWLLYAVVFSAYLALRHFATQHFAQGYITWSMVLSRPGESIVLVATRFAQSFRSLLVPLPLPGVSAMGIVIALAGAAAWAVRDAVTRRVVGLASIWMPLALLPFVGFFTFQQRYVYLASIGWTMLLVCGGSGLAGRLITQRWRQTAVAAGAAVWILACVASLQLHNRELRRNGAMSDQVVNALVAAVPRPAQRTLFVVAGLGPLRGSSLEWSHDPVLLFGLPEAARLRFNDQTVDVRFAEVPSSTASDAGRPVVHLQWNPRMGAFTR